MSGSTRLRLILLAVGLTAMFVTPAVSSVRGDGPSGQGAVSQPSRLSPLEGHSQSEAYAINAAGEIAGWSFGSAPKIAVLWDADGNPIELAPLPGDQESQAEGINDAGIVVGWSRGAGEAEMAVVWGPDRLPMELPRLPGHARSRARGINDAGVVIGRSWIDGTQRAVMWRQDGAVVELSRLPGDPGGEALGINTEGVIVGTSRDTPETGRARTAMVWYPDGSEASLSPLPGDEESIAIAINDVDLVVGESTRMIQAEDGCVLAFTGVAWDRTGQLRVLPPLADGVNGFPAFGCIVQGSHAADITNSGIAVGLSATGTQAVRWDPDGTPVALPPLPGDTFSWAHGVNEAGVAVGFSAVDASAKVKTAVVWR